MNYFRGEYWIEDGNVDFADGNVGDRNHEGVAVEYAGVQLADLCCVEYDSEGGFEELEQNLIEYAGELVGEGAEPPDNGVDAAITILKSDGKDPAQYSDLIDVALYRSGCDAREYAMEHWGWIWCKGTWFGMAKWDDESRDNLISGAQSILDEEGFYQGDAEEGEENPLDQELTIQTLDGKRLYMTLRELEAGKGGGEKAEPPAGPNAQLHDIDVKGQPEHYGTNLGDSRAARILNQLLEASGSVYPFTNLPGHLSGPQGGRA